MPTSNKPKLRIKNEDDRKLRRQITLSNKQVNAILRAGKSGLSQSIGLLLETIEKLSGQVKQLKKTIKELRGAK